MATRALREAALALGTKRRRRQWQPEGGISPSGLFLSRVFSCTVSYEEREAAASFGSLAPRALARAWAPLSPAVLERACTWILGLDPGERPLRARNSPRARHPDLVCRLIATSYELRLTDPAEALRVARAAVDVAEALEPRPGSARWLADLRANAWGNLANCCRLVDDHVQAEEAWNRADSLLEAGSRDKVLAGMLMLWKATLRQAQRRLTEAVALFGRAADLADKAQNGHVAAKCRLGLAISHFYSGDAKQALAVATQAAEKLDLRREPEMGLALFHNTLFFMEAERQHRLALALAERIEPWYRELGSDLLGYRASWLRGRLHFALGHFKTAAHHFEIARRGFLSAGQLYDAALTGFDLAFAWVSVGAHHQVQHLAMEMYPVFAAREIPREAAATLIAFADAARQQRLNVALMRKLASQLELLRRPGGLPAAGPEAA